MTIENFVWVELDVAIHKGLNDSVISNQMLARLYANLWDLHLQQDMHTNFLYPAIGNFIV